MAKTQNTERYELVLWDREIGWTNDGYGQEPCESENPDDLLTDVQGLRSVDEAFRATRFGARDTRTGEIVRDWPS